MALTCDYCGSIIGDKDYITVPFNMTEDKLGAGSADDWYYYCEDECAEPVRGVLENMRRFGHGGEQSGLRWTLTEGDGAPKVAPKPPGRVEGETADEPDGRKGGVRFGDLELHPHPAAALMREGIHNLEDVAKLREVEMLGMPGIGPNTVRKLRAELDRKGMEFRAGLSPEQLGEQLRAIREEIGLSRQELADKLNPRVEVEGSNGLCHREGSIYPATIGEWERGASPPNLSLLAEALGVPQDDFFRVRPTLLEDDQAKPEPPVAIDGPRLAALRMQRGMSQREVGNQLEPHVSQGRLSGWETGRYQPDRRYVDQLLDLFDVPLGVLEKAPGAPA